MRRAQLEHAALYAAWIVLLIAAAALPLRAQDSEPAGRGNPEQGLSTRAAAGGDTAALTAALLAHLAIWQRPDGSTIFAPHCRRAYGGCAARAQRMAGLFVRAARDHDVDVWLLVALATRESGLNPDAVGARGELGLMQLHPQSRAGRLAARLCEETPRHCPAILVDGAARVLRASIDRCGDVERGLVLYHTGRCGEPDAYVRSVIARRDRMRGSS